MPTVLSRRELLTLEVPQDTGGGEVVHIASLLLQVVPAHIDAVLEAVSQLQGAELHPTAHPMKFAVVLEAGDEHALADATQTLSQLPGVLTVAIVAHLIEQGSAIDEPVEKEYANESSAIPEA